MPSLSDRERITVVCRYANYSGSQFCSLSAVSGTISMLRRILPIKGGSWKYTTDGATKH